MLETQHPPVQPLVDSPNADSARPTLPQSGSVLPEQEVCDRVKRSLGHIYHHLMGVVEQERKLENDSEICQRERNTLREQNDALQHREQAVSQREAELAARQQQLDQFESEIRAKSQELEIAARDIGSMRNDFTARMRTLEDCERVISQFEQTFGKLVNAPEMRLSEAVEELTRFMDRHTA